MWKFSSKRFEIPREFREEFARCGEYVVREVLYKGYINSPLINQLDVWKEERSVEVYRYGGEWLIEQAWKAERKEALMHLVEIAILVLVATETALSLREFFYR